MYLSVFNSPVYYKCKAMIKWLNIRVKGWAALREDDKTVKAFLFSITVNCVAHIFYSF